MNKFGISRKHKAILFSIFIGVIISIITLTVVYASLSASLQITGRTDVVASNWDVHLANGQFTTSIPSINHGTAAPRSMSYIPDGYKVVPFVDTDIGCCSGTDCISSMSGTTGSFYTASLSKPGDFKAISFDVVNGGSIDAKLDGFVLNGICLHLKYRSRHSGPER